MKFAANTKINHKMVSFTDHYSDIYIGILSPKTKIGTNLISQLQKIYFLIKKKSSASGWWKCTKSCFNGNKFCKISSTEKTGKKTMTFTPKRKFQRETKPTIGNLDDELYQLENKKAKGAKRHANIK